MFERCKNVQLENPKLIATCRLITHRAIKSWLKAMGDQPGSRDMIRLVVNHRWPAIKPEFGHAEELEALRVAAEQKLGKPVQQIDGIRKDGLVNVLTR